jgi:transcriptional regulator with XRE-family HTH domain
MSQSELQAIGNLIREARNKQGYSIADVSDMTGISTGTICHIENGKVDAGFTTIRKVAKAVGLKLKALE